MATFEGWDESTFPLENTPRKTLDVFTYAMLDVFNTHAYLRTSYIKTYVLQLIVGCWGVAHITIDRPTSGWEIVWSVLIFAMFLHMAIRRHRYTVDTHDIYESVLTDTWVNIDNKVVLLEKLDTISTYGGSVTKSRSFTESLVLGVIVTTAWMYFSDKTTTSLLNNAMQFITTLIVCMLGGILFDWVNSVRGKRVRRNNGQTTTDGPSSSE
jgi:hypothetical protein